MVCTQVPHVWNPEWRFNLHCLAKFLSLIWRLKLFYKHYCYQQDTRSEGNINELTHRVWAQWCLFLPVMACAGDYCGFNTNFILPAQLPMKPPTQMKETLSKATSIPPILVIQSIFPTDFLPWAWYAVKLKTPSAATFFVTVNVKRMKWSE